MVTDQGTDPSLTSAAGVVVMHRSLLPWIPVAIAALYFLSQVGGATIGTRREVARAFSGSYRNVNHCCVGRELNISVVVVDEDEDVSDIRYLLQMVHAPCCTAGVPYSAGCPVHVVPGLSLSPNICQPPTHPTPSPALTTIVYIIMALYTMYLHINIHDKNCTVACIPL